MDPRLAPANLGKTPHTLGPTSGLELTSQWLAHGALKLLPANPPVFPAPGFPTEGRTLVSCALNTGSGEAGARSFSLHLVSIYYLGTLC